MQLHDMSQLGHCALLTVVTVNLVSVLCATVNKSKVVSDPVI